MCILAALSGLSGFKEKEHLKLGGRGVGRLEERVERERDTHTLGESKLDSMSEKLLDYLGHLGRCFKDE